MLLGLIFNEKRTSTFSKKNRKYRNIANIFFWGGQNFGGWQGLTGADRGRVGSARRPPAARAPNSRKFHFVRNFHFSKISNFYVFFVFFCDFFDVRFASKIKPRSILMSKKWIYVPRNPFSTPSDIKFRWNFVEIPMYVPFSRRKSRPDNARVQSPLGAFSNFEFWTFRVFFFL